MLRSPKLNTKAVYVGHLRTNTSIDQPLVTHLLKADLAAVWSSATQGVSSAAAESKKNVFVVSTCEGQVERKLKNIYSLIVSITSHPLSCLIYTWAERKERQSGEKDILRDRTKTKHAQTACRLSKLTTTSGRSH